MANIMDYQTKKNVNTWPRRPRDLVKVVTWGEAHCGGDSSQVQDQLKVAATWDVRRFWDE